MQKFNAKIFNVKILWRMLDLFSYNHKLFTCVGGSTEGFCWTRNTRGRQSGEYICRVVVNKCLLFVDMLVFVWDLQEKARCSQSAYTLTHMQTHTHTHVRTHAHAHTHTHTHTRTHTHLWYLIVFLHHLKGLKFKRFPYLLTLQLKRFDFDYSTMHRIKLNDKWVHVSTVYVNVEHWLSSSLCACLLYNL